MIILSVYNFTKKKGKINMKEIGFIDYYLSEFHADNYPNWISKACEEKGYSYSVSYAWAELDFSPRDGVTTEEWCKKMNLTSCSTIDELCEKSDAIVILAPSNPEKHLEYARNVLKYGKPTFIDKTFAESYQAATEIIDIAKKHGAPIYSTSALRYADELNKIAEPHNMITTGGGSDIFEYIIHQAEMIIKKLGTDISAVKASKRGLDYFIDVNFESGKLGTMIFGTGMHFSIYMDTENGEQTWKECRSDFFYGSICDMVRFFDSGVPSFDIEQTKQVIKLIELVKMSIENLDNWIKL